MNEQASGSFKLPPRRGSVWSVSDFSDGCDDAVTVDENQNDKQSQDQQQQVAGKITVRRKSARLLDKRKDLEEEENDGEPPVKKRRGRPPKAKNTNEKKTPSKTGTDIGTGAEATVQRNASNSNNSFDFGIKAKCELTKLILDIFNDFENNPDHQNRYSARCTLCDEHQDRIKYVRGNNTNLKSHLERMHPKQYATICTKANQNELQKLCGKNVFTDTDIESAVLNLVIKERLPLVKVESIHLKKLIQVCLNSRAAPERVYQNLKRATLRRKIQEEAVKLRENFKEIFKNVQYFCATSDIWSRSNKSFIAVSVHYFETDTLELQTKFIACEPFPGNHTHDRVAKKLHGIFDRFDIVERVFFVTTDGAGEYTAAFKYFGDNYRTIHLMSASDENFDWMDRSGVGDHHDDGAGTSSGSCSNQNSNESGANSHTSDSDFDDDDPDSFVRLFHCDSDADDQNDDSAGQNLESESESETFRIHEQSSSSHPLLANMNRIDCSAHKLDKMGKFDVDLAAGHDEAYDSYHTRVFDKLNQIWNLKDSRLKAEIFTRITDKKLTAPHRIRWFKTCEAIGNILSIDRNKLENACSQLGIEPFDTEEYNFLRQYFEIINKVAIALKVLEGDKHPFGLYLPTLFGLRATLSKYANIDPTENQKCTQLAIALRNGFNNRFASLMDVFSSDGKSSPLYIAMITNPKYKLNYMGTRVIDPRVLSKLKEILLTAALEIERMNKSCETSNDSNVVDAEQNHDSGSAHTHKDGLNELLIENDVSVTFKNMFTEKERITKEIEAYMVTPTTSNIMEGLAKYPIIRQLYLKFNCVRSSEAICERMFSYAGRNNLVHGFISFQRNYGGYSVLRIGNQNKGKRKAIGMILTDKRGRLTCEFFEDLLLLHMNEY